MVLAWEDGVIPLPLASPLYSDGAEGNMLLGGKQRRGGRKSASAAGTCWKRPDASAPGVAKNFLQPTDRVRRPAGHTGPVGKTAMLILSERVGQIRDALNAIPLH
jgi:hypothetical protein